MHKLAVDGIRKSYGKVEVLKGVSLQAAAGDVISIIGASGSGKSTFLRCINSSSARPPAASSSTARR